MFSPFHILKVQNDGSLRWTEGALNVERAKARVKVLSAFSPGEYVITNLTGKKISIKSQPKRILFQIGYDQRELNLRAQLFRRCGHEVLSAADNEAAKRALTSIDRKSTRLNSSHRTISYAVFCLKKKKKKKTVIIKQNTIHHLYTNLPL